MTRSNQRGPVHAGVACPPSSALRVWLPSRRFTPSPAWSASRRRQRLWGSPFGAFSSFEVAMAFLPPLAPHAVTTDFASTNPQVHRSWSLKTDSRVRPRRSPSRFAGMNRPDGAGCSHGILPFQGLRSPALAALRAASSLALIRAGRLPRPMPHCASESQSADACARLASGDPS
jgi:hypothetical protein